MKSLCQDISNHLNETAKSEEWIVSTVGKFLWPWLSMAAYSLKTFQKMNDFPQFCQKTLQLIVPSAITHVDLCFYNLNVSFKFFFLKEINTFIQEGCIKGTRRNFWPSSS